MHRLGGCGSRELAPFAIEVSLVEVAALGRDLADAVGSVLAGVRGGAGIEIGRAHV